MPLYYVQLPTIHSMLCTHCAGTCKCKSGYIRGREGECIPINLKDAAINSLTDSLTEKILNLSSTTLSTAKKHLTITAESKVVKLPDSEVSLTASVSPSQGDSEDKYQYEWTSLHQPEGSGAVKHQNGETLQLTKLSEGLYTFKVIFYIYIYFTNNNNNTARSRVN